MSFDVYALSVPPMDSIFFMYSPRPIFSVPSKSRCSKKWANPVRSGFSFLEPTWYITDTATIGVALSWCINTVKPLSSLNSLNSMRFWAIVMLLAQSDKPKKAEMVKILFIVLYDINRTYWMFMIKHTASLLFLDEKRQRLLQLSYNLRF